MAAGTSSHTGNYSLMRKFVEQFEKTVNASPIVLSSHIEKQFGPDGTTLYLRAGLRFIDSSVLEIALFTSETPHGINIDKYRFHYMSAAGHMIFRYDNAPHHPETDSFPHHKHIPDKVMPSSVPTIRNLLNEISTIILQEQF
jgi:hypothetical protein